jgi:protein-S-isoprenylcysteine O-methyltransferase Ste14
MSGKMIASAIILTIAIVGQIIMTFVLYNPDGNAALVNLGWGVLIISAVFGWLPIFTFRKKGKVKGRGYMPTTVLVDSGVYAIVRHPQYLAGILISIALPLITPHWIVVVLGIVAIGTNFYDTFMVEENCIKKFGENYRLYMERVPRLNFIRGIYRLFIR